jgi:hypothetical protein
MNKILLSFIVLSGFININAQCTLEKGNLDFPFTINGVTVTGTGTGNYQNYAPSYNSCGVPMKANSVWIGQSSAATYVNTFSSGVNDMIYSIGGANQGEIITVTSNSGPVTITVLASSCPSNIIINGIKELPIKV